MGNQSLQLPLQQDVIVPDVKPDIEKILQVDSKVMFDTMSVETTRVKFSGRVECNMLYLSEGPNRTVHNMKTIFNVDDHVNIEGAATDAIVRLDGYVENMRIEKLNSRKVNINCLIDVGVVVEEKACKSVIVGAEGLGDLQVRKHPFEVRQLVMIKDEKFIVKDQIAVPLGKDNIAEVLWCDMGIRNKELKVLDDKLAVKGDLNVSVLYTGNNEERTLEFVEKDVPFSGIVESFGVHQDMYADMDMKIAKYYLQVVEDMDGEERVLELEVVTEMNMKVYSQEKKEIISDLYSPSKNILINKEKAKFQNLVYKNQMKATIADTIMLGKEHPDMMQLFYVSANCKVEDVEIVDDAIMAEGVIFAKVFYVAADDNNPLCSFDEVLPFRQRIEARNARPLHKVEVKSYVEHASCNMMSSREVEIRCSMGFDANVLDEYEYELITGVEESEKDMMVVESMPSLTIYVADQQDTMWDIAKKYNTTIKDIMSINELKEEAVMPGQKLLVVKKLMDY